MNYNICMVYLSFSFSFFLILLQFIAINGQDVIKIRIIIIYIQLSEDGRGEDIFDIIFLLLEVDQKCHLSLLAPNNV
jgi:hypothetical protein